MASTDSPSGELPAGTLTLGFLIALGLVRTALLGVTGGVTALGFGLAGSPHPWMLATVGSKVWMVGIDVVTVLLVARLLTREQTSLRAMLDPRPYGKTALYALAGLVAIYFAMALGGFVGNFLIYYGARTPTETIHPPLWIGIILAVVAPVTVAVAEESLFRGYLIPRLQPLVGKVGAVIVSALLASSQSLAINLGDGEAMVAGMLNSFVIALAFGALFLWQKRIAALVVVHWFFSAVVGVVVLLSALQ